MTLAPGASVGPHTHPTDDEIYYIISGQGEVIEDDGKKVAVGPGEDVYKRQAVTVAASSPGSMVHIAASVSSTAVIRRNRFRFIPIAPLYGLYPHFFLDVTNEVWKKRTAVKI